MRMILRSIRRFSSSVRYRDHNFYGFVAQRKLWVDSRHRCLYKLSSKPDIGMCKHPTSMLSRDLITSAAGVANREVNRGGPLVEYERRIAAGELFDGDACQVILKVIL
nr:AFG1-like ATPase isoform X1 [Ipomoea batatas]